MANRKRIACGDSMNLTSINHFNWIKLIDSKIGTLVLQGKESLDYEYYSGFNNSETPALVIGRQEKLSRTGGPKVIITLLTVHGTVKIRHFWRVANYNPVAIL